MPPAPLLDWLRPAILALVAALLLNYVVSATPLSVAGTGAPGGDRTDRTGQAPDLQVCNPVQARIGHKPKLVFHGRLDGYLWVKHPGESDGPCNGGPASGEWWPEGALRLLGQA